MRLADWIVLIGCGIFMALVAMCFVIYATPIG